MGEDYQVAKPNYPAINFLLRFGRPLSAVVAIAVLALGIGLGVYWANVLVAIGGVVAAAFAYLLMRSYVELVTVMADMLLPK